MSSNQTTNRKLWLWLIGANAALIPFYPFLAGAIVGLESARG